MVNKSIVKGCALFSGMALKVVALVALCAGMSMAQHMQMECRGTHSIDPVDKQKLNKMYGALTSKGNLRFSPFHESLQVPSRNYKLKVYQRTDSSSYFQFVLNSDYERNNKNYYYGRYIDYPHTVTSDCEEYNGPIWVSDFLGEEPEYFDYYTYMHHAPVIGEYTNSFATLELYHEAEAFLYSQQTVPSYTGVPYVQYNFNTLRSEDNEQNRIAVSNLLDSLKKYNIRHVRLAFAPDGVIYNFSSTNRRTWAQHYCGTHPSYQHNCEAEMRLYYFDLDIPYAVGTVSLSADSSIYKKETIRDSAQMVWLEMSGERAFKYVLQRRYGTDHGWTTVSGTTGEVDASSAATGVSLNPTIPADYFIANAEMIQLRYAMIPLDDKGAPMKKDTSYTSEVTLNFLNRINVETKVDNTLSGDYKLTSTEGEIYPKDYGFYNTTVLVQAIAPAGYKFRCWAKYLNSTSECATTENPIHVKVDTRDTSLRALFQSDADDVNLSLYVSKNGTTEYASASESPSNFDVVLGDSLKVVWNIAANEESCPLNQAGTKRICDSRLVVRRDGAAKWDSVTHAYANTNNGFNNTTVYKKIQDYFKDGRTFEAKVVCAKADGSIAESNSIFFNVKVKLCFEGAWDVDDASTVNNAIGAVFENEIGETQISTGGTACKNQNVSFYYGSKIKVRPSPEYFPYKNDFYCWRVGPTSYSQRGREYCLSRDSVFEISLDSSGRTTLGMGFAYRTDYDSVIVFSDGMPYAGRNLWQPYAQGRYDVKSWSIKKGSAIFAENQLDSMFTPGSYTLSVTLAHKRDYTSERDSLWACDGNYPVVLYYAENGELNNMVKPNAYEENWKNCTTDEPKEYWFNYSFTVNDTSYIVEFYSQDEATGEYTNLVSSASVPFGVVPTAPEVTCPESNSQWTFSCDWAPEITAAIADADYNYVISSTSVEPPESSSAAESASSSSALMASSSAMAGSSSSLMASSSSKDEPSSSMDKPQSSSSNEAKPTSSAEKPKSSSSRGRPRSSSSADKSESIRSMTVAGVQMSYAHNELSLSINGSASVNIQVFDLMGHLEESFLDLSTGEHVVSLAKLKRGSYIVRMVRGNSVKSLRIAVR